MCPVIATPVMESYRPVKHDTDTSQLHSHIQAPPLVQTPKGPLTIVPQDHVDAANAERSGSQDSTTRNAHIVWPDQEGKRKPGSIVPSSHIAAAIVDRHHDR